MFVLITLKDNVLQNVIGCRSKQPAADSLFCDTLFGLVAHEEGREQFTIHELQDAMENGYQEVGDLTVCLLDLSNWTNILPVLAKLVHVFENFFSGATESEIRDALTAAKSMLNDGPHLDSICAKDGKLSDDGWELSDGGVIEHPDDYPRLGGTIRRCDKDGNCEEIRNPGDEGYDEWRQLFTSEYCPQCQEPEHDTCSLTTGCPCCHDTIRRNTSAPIQYPIAPEPKDWGSPKT